MTALMDQFKEKVDMTLASLESEVGDFLKTKEAILRLPQTLVKQTLLNENAVLKERATKAIADAQAVKAMLSSFNPLDFASYKNVPSLTRSAGVTAESLVRLREDMKAHRSRVEQASSSIPPNPNKASWSTMPGAKAVGMGLLALAGWSGWRAWKKRGGK